MDGGSPASCSSGEEDGDAEWRAAIDSVAAIDFSISASKSNGPTRPGLVTGRPTDGGPGHEQQALEEKPKAPALKLYQIRAQELLDHLLDQSLEMVRGTTPPLGDDSQSEEGGIKLFRKAPRGILLDPPVAHFQLYKKPRILPGEEIDDKSKKFRRQLRSVAVDGIDVMTAAQEACRKSLGRLEAKEAAAKAAAQKEEERISELKKVRGEKWLPSMAREMQGRI